MRIGSAPGIDVERMALRSRVHELFVESRSSTGTRSIMSMMREEGMAIGRLKVSRLMGELGLVCKQPGKHAYKQATVERVDIPNHLNPRPPYSTVTDFARLRGLSTSVPRASAVW